MLPSNQLGIIDAQKYDRTVHKLYHDISDIEVSEEPPKIKLESNTIDFGKISSVPSRCLRFLARDSCDFLQL